MIPGLLLAWRLDEELLGFKSQFSMSLRSKPELKVPPMPWNMQTFWEGSCSKVRNAAWSLRAVSGSMEFFLCMRFMPIIVMPSGPRVNWMAEGSGSRCGGVIGVIGKMVGVVIVVVVVGICTWNYKRGLGHKVCTDQIIAGISSMT